MKVHTQWMPGTDTYGVWFLLDYGPTFDQPRKWGIGRFAEGGQLVWDDYEDGAEKQTPTLVLPGSLVEDLRAALNGHDFPGGGSTAHLRDAIATRDRLLALVEGQLPSKGNRA